MTVQNTVTKNRYIGNGVTTEWPITFEVTDAEHVHVYIRKNGVEEETNNYTVDMDKKQIVYPKTGEPLAPEEKLVIVRRLPLHQELDLENQGPFFAEDIERAFDESRMIDQQLKEDIDRALQVTITSDADVETVLPWGQGKYIKWDKDGKKLELGSGLDDDAKNYVDNSLEQISEDAQKYTDDKLEELDSEVKTFINTKLADLDNVSSKRKIKLGEDLTCTAGTLLGYKAGGYVLCDNTDYTTFKNVVLALEAPDEQGNVKVLLQGEYPVEGLEDGADVYVGTEGAYTTTAPSDGGSFIKLVGTVEGNAIQFHPDSIAIQLA